MVLTLQSVHEMLMCDSNQMLLNATVATGMRLFQNSFPQYFGKDSKESFTPYYRGRLSEEQSMKLTVKKIFQS